MSILALASDTLVGTAGAGQIEYNGQFFGTDSNASRAQMQRITQGTAVASTSGTSIDFTSLPAWCKKITVMFSGVSTSGTSSLLVQLGDSGGIENTGYLSTSITDDTGGGSLGTSSTAGFVYYQDQASYVGYGIVTIALVSGNIWVSSHTGRMTTTNVVTGGGGKTLSDTLTQVRITTVNGTDTFDAGSINIMYEG
jgi:hypothetical protein